MESCTSKGLPKFFGEHSSIGLLICFGVEGFSTLTLRDPSRRLVGGLNVVQQCLGGSAQIVPRYITA